MTGSRNAEFSGGGKRTREVAVRDAYFCGSKCSKAPQPIA